MTKDEFLVEMQELLQTDTELSFDTVLEDLEEWDSLSMMATIAFLKKNFEVALKLSEIKSITTIGEIADKVAL